MEENGRKSTSKYRFVYDSACKKTCFNSSPLGKYNLGKEAISCFNKQSPNSKCKIVPLRHPLDTYSSEREQEIPTNTFCAFLQRMFLEHIRIQKVLLQTLNCALIAAPGGRCISLSVPFPTAHHVLDQV